MFSRGVNDQTEGFCPSSPPNYSLRYTAVTRYVREPNSHEESCHITSLPCNSSVARTSLHDVAITVKCPYRFSPQNSPLPLKRCGTHHAYRSWVCPFYSPVVHMGRFVLSIRARASFPNNTARPSVSRLLSNERHAAVTKAHASLSPP